MRNNKNNKNNCKKKKTEKHLKKLTSLRESSNIKKELFKKVIIFQHKTLAEVEEAKALEENEN